ncbi:response regulator transcription factor [Bacillus altitudinis]|uniref:response regulator transcription factor n=1 Tax=Bacillus altitudinis TaxID=293387 RepID=UPI0003A4A628|nr:response regulator transcription factor [Bacillus altitudinis]
MKRGLFMKEISIMVIDDEAQMRKMLRVFLEKKGFSVYESTDGFHALTLLSKKKPHLLIVDVMMPFMDGFKFVQEVKQQTSIPIIFLSAKGSECDKIRGLKLGGDDYIVKPFMPRELLARIESVLRRVYGHRMISNTFTIGPLVIDYDAHQMKLNQHSLSLTRKEFGLLNILATNCGRVFSRTQLLHLVWGENKKSSERTVDTHIKTLRLKMGENGYLIETVWGLGYKFEL